MLNHRKRSRRGATVVEFAVTAPVVVLLFFTAYELARMNMVRHTVDIAAYEGARRAIVPGATVNDIEARVNSVLAPTGVRLQNVDVVPDPIDRSTREVTVDIDVAMSGNGWILPKFVGGLTLEGTSTLAREGYTSPTN